MSSVSFVNALQDNYIWIIISDNRRHAIVIDPGEAAPVRTFLQKHCLQLNAILLTHHHPDHSAGVADLVAQYHCPVYGMQREELPWVTQIVTQQNKIQLDNFTHAIEIIEVPGHTRDHLAYRHSSALFCGDTLFAGGCGRLFEGSAKQLYDSLLKLSSLPEETRIYCGHEYTINNLLFAEWIEPDNVDIKQRLTQAKQLRQQNLPTVPSALKIEKLTNPFLRCHLAHIRKRIAELAKQSIMDAESTFACVRKLKDQWQPT